MDTESDLDRTVKAALLVDAFNVVGLMAPPTRAARRTWAASRISRGGASAHGATSAVREEEIAADAAAAAATATAAVDAARTTSAGKTRLEG